jgi:hypothetical protein
MQIDFPDTTTSTSNAQKLKLRSAPQSPETGIDLRVEYQKLLLSTGSIQLDN